MSSFGSSASAQEPLILLDGVVKTFRDFWHRPVVRAVKGVSLGIGAGEIFGLLGPNGSGKSTTLKMILGLLNPTAGVIRVFGRSPREVSIKARIGYLPEETRLYPYLTASEVLRFYGRLFDLTPDECRKRVKQLLEMTGLTHVRDRRVGEFSKGMARRLGLAQALINDPDLLVLDEPTSGLDPIGCRQVKDLIQSLGRRGKTILMSSHLLADVQDVCDRLAILRHGRLVVVGRTRDLLEDRGAVSLILEGVSEDTAREVAAVIHERFNLDARLERPLRSLERFFLEMIQKAPSPDAPDVSGAVPVSGVAPYLTPSSVSSDRESAGARVPPAEPASGEETEARLEHLLVKPGDPHA